MADSLYSSPAWAEARAAALDRDGHRCTVARLLGGECADRLDVHHVIPVREGGAWYDDDNLITVCQSHHPMVESIRRQILHKRGVRKCPHDHRYDHARRECERRLAMG